MATQVPARTVLIQDRSKLFRSSLAVLLDAQEDIRVLSQVATAEELERATIAMEPDIVVFEVSSTPWDSEGVARRLGELEKRPRLVGVGRSPAGAVKSRLDGGAVARHDPFEEFLGAITGVLRSDDSALETPAGDGPLTEAELHVLGLLSSGLTTNQIARRMGRSPRSVRALRERVLKRLGAQSGAQAAAEGIRLGLLGPRVPPGATGPHVRGRPYRPPELRVRRWDGRGARLLIAHESRILTAAVELVLGEAAKVIYHTVFASAAVAVSDVLVPELVVTGDLLSDGPVEHHLRALMRSGTRMLVVTDQPEPRRAVTLLRGGCSGVSDSDSDIHEVAAAALTVAGGGSVIPPVVAELLLAEWRTKDGPIGRRESELRLTDRELEVLRAMADGLATKAIARRLNMAAKTAENHKTRIFQKMGVRGHAEAISLLYRGGDLAPEAACGAMAEATHNIRPARGDRRASV